MSFQALPNKDPNEILDYPVSFTQWLATGAALDANNCTVTVIEGNTGTNDLLVDAVVVAAGVVTPWLSGGVVGVRYKLKVTVRDNATPRYRVGVRRFTIKVAEK